MYACVTIFGIPQNYLVIPSVLTVSVISVSDLSVVLCVLVCDVFSVCFLVFQQVHVEVNSELRSPYRLMISLFYSEVQFSPIHKSHDCNQYTLGYSMN